MNRRRAIWLAIALDLALWASAVALFFCLFYPTCF